MDIFIANSIDNNYEKFCAEIFYLGGEMAISQNHVFGRKVITPSVRTTHIDLDLTVKTLQEQIKNLPKLSTTNVL